MSQNILSQIAELENMSINQLQVKYRQLFDNDIGIQNNKPYLIRKIAYKIQEMEFGGLQKPALTKLDEYIKEFDPINKVTQSQNGKPIAKSNRDRRVPVPGTVITKEYKGNKIHVKVFEKEFEYKGKKYKSLSSIANEVTGSRWNGYVFFNL